MIYHVVTKNRWQTALQQGYYEADSLAIEGFIHASKAAQVKGVLDRYYQNQQGLILLHIDETKLTAELKYELAPSVNEEFPHIFGRLNTAAVIKTTPL
ncbi:MAG: DUF952 domain-containing protein [Ferruginibacter sp.]|nr:DUF952 domain-containing protein [Ferruginibacter sp.]